MPSEIQMPPLPNREVGRLARWFVSEGSRIAAGDVIAEVETETATLEIEASGEGVIEKLLVPAGAAIVPCGTPIAAIGQGGTRPEKSLHSHFSLFGTVEPGLDGPPQEAVDAEPSVETIAAGTSAPQTTVIQSGREALRDALAHALERDPTVILLGADVAQNAGAEAVTQGLIDRFGAERIVTVPPLPGATAGLALGASLAGLRPILCLESWETAGPVIDAIVEADLGCSDGSGSGPGAPLVIRGTATGSFPERALIARLIALSGVTVVAPSTPAAAYAVTTAAATAGGRIAILEPSALYVTEEAVEQHGPVWSITRARVLRQGPDLTIVAYGAGVAAALEIAAALDATGTDASVLDLVALAPLDLDSVLASIAVTRRLAVIDLGVGFDPVSARLVADVAERAFRSLDGAPVRVSLAGSPGPDHIREAAGLIRSAMAETAPS